jgi:hypothetical protein
LRGAPEKLAPNFKNKNHHNMNYQILAVPRRNSFSQPWRTQTTSRLGSGLWRRNQNTVKFKQDRKLGPVAHAVLVAVMLAVLGLIYLTQITKTSAYGYQINDLNTQKEQLVSEQRDLEVEAARLQALEKVQQSSVARALETPRETSYAN